ncbi:MAG: protein kinase [Blastocatellia bacterium]|nr:protein kinase [Blastocatellia bacterium]
MSNRRPPNSQLEAGVLLSDRYQIVKRVGGGGMGSVYLAYDTRLNNKQRAVKEMIELFSDEGQRKKAVEDFKREAQLLASLEHVSIPTIFDYFISSDGRYYLVMKYIGGGDLAGRLKKNGGAIEERLVTEWGIQVCDVLYYIHSQNPPIIYRDLKPANLMVDDSTNPPRIMLVDFGIARFVSPTQKGVTAIGTMGYAPPELFSGKVEPRSDIYSLGATMFHLMTGVDPQDNPLLIFDFTKNPRPRQIKPTLTLEMDNILARSVEHKPERRFASALEMKQVLEEHLRRLDQMPAPPPVPVSNYGREMSYQLPSDQVFCGNCGQRIARDDFYCPHCGAKQPIAMSSQPKEAPSASRAIAKLVILEPSDHPISFLLDKDTNLIGRNDPHTGVFPEVDLTSFDPETKVSRRHARVFREGGIFLVEDLSSVNGTWINEDVKLYPKQPRALQEGDKLRLGETTLKFVLG